MSRVSTIENLEARKAELLAQLKQVEQAIKVARDKEQQKRSKAILDALAARGLLDTDLDALIAAIAKTSPAAMLAVSPKEPQPVQSANSFSNESDA